MRFRSKVVEIEAFQWFKNGDHPLDRVGEELKDEVGQTSYTRQEGAVVRYFRHPAPEFCGGCHCPDCGETFHNHGYIDTAQGGHKVCPGDWIIPESHSPGKFYPCKPDVFAARYESVGISGMIEGPSQREVGDQRILGDSPLSIGVSRR